MVISILLSERGNWSYLGFLTARVFIHTEFSPLVYYIFSIKPDSHNTSQNMNETIILTYIWLRRFICDTHICRYPIGTLFILAESSEKLSSWNINTSVTLNTFPSLFHIWHKRTGVLRTSIDYIEHRVKIILQAT